MPKQPINPSQLCIGLFVILDLPWMKHSFMSNSFKIKNEKQLAELKSLGLKQVIYDPDKSDAEPLPLEAVKETSEVSAPEPSEQDTAMWEEKQARIKKMKERRVCLNRCEKEYTKTVGAVRNMMKSVLAQPEAAIEAADEMASEIVGNLMVNQDTTLHLVNMKGKSESTYFHAINVSILSMMLGKQLGLDEKQLNKLGTGALFHDLGHLEVPDKVLRKTEPLNKAELEAYRMHPIYGLRLAEKMGSLPADVVTVIVQHHEMADGSGYPNGLSGSQISELAQIVAIVNAYDNLCNKTDSSKSLTPYEAMSMLFAKEKQKFNEDKLTTFITNMGVFPPGTVVKLSNGFMAAVVSINSSSLLSPKVMVYDPQIPKSEALILDLLEEDLKITGGLRPGSLPVEVLEYLNLSDNVNFFFDPGSRDK
jgi:HD-GYP domain-containing protein (c-di-GMP phosphodiesterase class II)